MDNSRSNIEETLNKEKPGEAASPSIERMASDLAYLEATGALPEGFDIEQAGSDPAFIELMEAFPAEAAVRVYAAERRAENAENDAKQRMNEQLQRRNALPRSTRAGIAASPKPDFGGMSSEAFRAYEQQLKRAAARGVRVPL